MNHSFLARSTGLFIVFFAAWGMVANQVLAQNLSGPAAASSASVSGSAALSGLNPSTLPSNITLPPGVQLPLGVALPKGMTVNAPRQANQLSPDVITPNTKSEKNANNSEMNIEALVPNPFQAFIAQTTGKSLLIYGQNLFERGNPFAALESVPVPGNYILGPGDEITLKIYSSAIDIDQRFVINRDGTVVLPKIGPVVLAGTKVSEVETRLKAQLSRLISDFNVYVSVAQLKGIEIYVVGQTRKPGKFIVSSVSTLINALFATGGPNSNGSMRQIQLVRQGKVVGTVDLYNFLLTGDSSKDLVLMAGDVINIPPIGPQVALLGSIPNQAVYELLPQQSAATLESVIRQAGKLPVFTSPLQASIERIDSSKEKPLSAMTVALDAQGLATTLKDGDVVTLFPIKPAFDNAISLRILGEQSIRVPLKEGAKIKDIFPTRESLFTSAYFLRRFNPPQPSSEVTSDLNRIRKNALLDQINWEYALIERINPDDLKPEIISFDLGKAISMSDSNQNITLRPGDVLTVFSFKDIQAPVERQTRIVKIQGEVRAPGIYQLGANETLSQVIAKAGGLTNQAYLFGTQLSRESVRAQQKENLNQVIKRLESQMSSFEKTIDVSSQQNIESSQRLQTMNRVQAEQKVAALKSLVPNGRIALELNPYKPVLPEMALEDGDEITVPRVPTAVTAVGAVYNESALIYKPGRSVSDYLKVAGVTNTAEREWIFVARADGSIKAPDLDAWIFSGNVSSLELMPGDTIVVPEKIIRETGYSVFMRGLKDWTQVLGQLGLTAAAIKVLR